MDGWNTIISFWDGQFSGSKKLVSGRVLVYFWWGVNHPRHPDKVRSCDPGEAKAAFARLDAAAKVVEALFELGLYLRYALVMPYSCRFFVFF